MIYTLLMAIISYSGYADKPYQMVYVKDCSGRKFVNIYSDIKKTIPLPNPFISGRDGNYTFFTDGGCFLVRDEEMSRWKEIRTGDFNGIGESQ
jgi:hypothetical protein